MLSTVGEQQGPPLGFTAAGITRRGRRIRLVRWSAGLAAGFVVAAAVTVSVVLTSGRDVEPATRPPAVTTTDVETTVTETTTDTPTSTPTTTTTTTTTTT